MKRKIGLLTAVALSGAAAFAQDVKVGGYVDGGWNWDKHPTSGDESRFSLNEANLSVTGTSGNAFAGVQLDLPQVDLAHLDQTAVHLSRFWAGFKYDNGFNWKVGTFDGFLGNESQYSNKRYFENEGLVSNKFWKAYGGLGLGYSVSDSLGIDLAVANDISMTMGLPGASIHSPMMAVKLSTKMDDVSAFVGAEFQKANGNTNYHLDVGAHAKMAQLHVGAEVAMSKENGGDNGFGFGAHVGYDVMDATQLLARFDWANAAYNGQAASGYELTVGPTFKMSDALNVRVHYQMSHNTTAAQLTDHAIGLNGVYTF